MARPQKSPESLHDRELRHVSLHFFRAVSLFRSQHKNSTCFRPICALIKQFLNTTSRVRACCRQWNALFSAQTVDLLTLKFNSYCSARLCPLNLSTANSTTCNKARPPRGTARAVTVAMKGSLVTFFYNFPKKNFLGKFPLHKRNFS